MTHPDSLFALFKPVLWLMLASFLIGFAGLVTLAGPSAMSGAVQQTELAAAMETADFQSQGS